MLKDFEEPKAPNPTQISEPKTHKDPNASNPHGKLNTQRHQAAQLHLKVWETQRSKPWADTANVGNPKAQKETQHSKIWGTQRSKSLRKLNASKTQRWQLWEHSRRGTKTRWSPAPKDPGEPKNVGDPKAQ